MKYLTKRVYSLKDIAMKMMKTAIVTASVLASALFLHKVRALMQVLLLK
jgi:hypothetical protein